MHTLTRWLGRWVALAAAALLLMGCAAPLVNQASYVAAVLDQVQRAGNGLTTLSGLAGSPQIDDPAWREQVTAEIATLRAVAAEARALTPPEALAGAHQSYLDALTRLDEALTSVEGAVAASDPARLREAVPLLAEVEQLIAATRGLIGG